MGLKYLDVSWMESRLSNLESQASRLSGEIDRAASNSKQTLRDATNQQNTLSRTLSTAQSNLQSLSDRAASIEARLQKLTQELDKFWARAEELERLVKQLQKQHDQADKLLDKDIGSLNDLATDLNKLAKHWTELTEEFNSMNLSVAEHQRILNDLASSSVSSQVLHSLRENLQAFALPEAQLLEESMASFFKAVEDRSAALAGKITGADYQPLLDEIDETIDFEIYAFQEEEEMSQTETEAEQIRTQQKEKEKRTSTRRQKEGKEHE